MITNDNQFIKNQIDSVYSNFNGGFFVDISYNDNVNSPLSYLEEKYWSGVCISNNTEYIKNRNCYIENINIDLNCLYNRDSFDRNYIYSLIANNDKSFLYHVLYLNSENSEIILKSLLNSLYNIPYDLNPDNGYWVTTILMLIVKLKNPDEIISICDKYFLKLYNQNNGIFVFKNSILSNI